MGSNIDWTLADCCQQQQYVIIGIIAGWVLVTLLLWKLPYILLPFKLLTVFLHEFGHASAAWLTCGRVIKIVVKGNDSGYTVTTGGIPIFILSAGYVGSCLWGMVILLLGSINITTLRIAAVVLLSILLLVLLIYSGNWTIRLLSVGFIIYISVVWGFTEYFRIIWPLRIILLQIGVMNALYSLWDVLTDVLCRTNMESDAYKLGELTKVNWRIWSVLWSVISLAFLGATLYLLLSIREVGNTSF